MSLSEREQRMLHEIEQSLLSEDPRFGSRFEDDAASATLNDFLGGEEKTTHSSSKGFPLRGVALFAVGLLLVVGGVALSQTSLWFVVISVLGFVLMFVSGLWILRGGGMVTRSSSQGKKSVSGSSTKRRSAGSVSAKMEENFHRRFEGQ